MPNPDGIYDDIANSFAKTLDRMGKGEREDGNERRQITFHSFRRFVKTTISDLGYMDYSEYFIGHSGSTMICQPGHLVKLKPCFVLTKSRLYFECL